MKKKWWIVIIVAIVLIIGLTYYFYKKSPMPENCAKAGEVSFSDVTGEQKECCPGLKEIAGVPKGNSSEDCENLLSMEGWPSKCSNCGNGECETWENICNCREDCK